MTTMWSARSTRRRRRKRRRSSRNFSSGLCWKRRTKIKGDPYDYAETESGGAHPYCNLRCPSRRSAYLMGMASNFLCICNCGDPFDQFVYAAVCHFFAYKVSAAAGRLSEKGVFLLAIHSDIGDCLSYGVADFILEKDYEGRCL